MARLRVGVIGCGTVAQIMWLPNLRELDEHFELAAICERLGLAHEVIDEYRANAVGMLEYQRKVPGLDLDKYQRQKVRHYLNRCREMGISPDQSLVDQILDPEIDFVVGVEAG